MSKKQHTEAANGSEQQSLGGAEVTRIKDAARVKMQSFDLRSGKEQKKGTVVLSAHDFYARLMQEIGEEGY